MSYATRGGLRHADGAYVRGQPNANGYKYGPGRFVASAKVPERNIARVIAGDSFAMHGFELLGPTAAFVAWFECVLDAFDALKASRGAGMVVRCADRILLKRRLPLRGST